jgi:hypothetical protein
MSKLFLKIPAIIVLVIAVIFLVGFITMLLWNELLPGIFHAPIITFWQALGLLVLSKILLGGFHPAFKDHRLRRKNHDFWHRRFEEKLDAMSPEEREKFIERWKTRCGSKFGEQALDQKSNT